MVLINIFIISLAIINIFYGQITNNPNEIGDLVEAIVKDSCRKVICCAKLLKEKIEKEVAYIQNFQYI
jgi:hypothetical protein